MSFSRKNYHGLNWSWYAVDADDNVGIFISGYSPIPLAIFEDNTQDNYYYLIKPLEELKEEVNSFLTPKKKLEHDQGIDDYSDFLLDAAMGVYVFEGDEGAYELMAYPEKPIKLHDLPEQTAKEISKVTFSKIKFSEVDELNVPDYFEC